MVVYCVSVQVLPGHEEDFRQATKVNHQKTRKESGNLRFDILQADEDSCHFMLYEVYRSDDAVKAHKETKHYKVWRERVAPWMARERQGTRFTPQYPSSEELW